MGTAEAAPACYGRPMKRPEAIRANTARLAEMRANRTLLAERMREVDPDAFAETSDRFRQFDLLAAEVEIAPVSEEFVEHLRSQASVIRRDLEARYRGDAVVDPPNYQAVAVGLAAEVEADALQLYVVTPHNEIVTISEHIV